jgi:glutathione S-transferase
VRDSEEDTGLPRPRVFLLPQWIDVDADGRAVARTDSTPMLRDLDRRYPGRRLRPGDPVLALVDSLVEDWADEWLTKAMFHYRWAFDADIQQASQILPRWSQPSRPEDQVKFGGGLFAQRQIERLSVVGSNATTAPVIEESYHRALAVLDAHLAGSRFLLGGRPAACDFAIYGQLTQLARFDPTPAAIAIAEAPRIVAWVDVVEELSGLEPRDDDWTPRSKLPSTLRAVLGEIGRLYVPFLLANADALARGAESVECTLAGKPWTQKPFPYQAKCLAWLREEHAALPAESRRDADALLAGTGCEALFA